MVIVALPEKLLLKKPQCHGEKVTLKCVPIQVLYDINKQSEPSKSGYIISSLNVAEDVAIARIESWLGDMKFADMFTLVKDSNDWKIVSKVYHVK